MTKATIEKERHPWPPYIPDNARILIMGTFPPGEHRWSMRFFYPNPINDFWRIMGIIFYGEKDKLYIPELKTFDLPRIKELLNERHIAMGDTGLEVRRLKGNAADKFLEIVTPMPLEQTLLAMPHCDTIATTGEKAAAVVAQLTGTEIPKTGTYVEADYANRRLRIYRMPSTSRAYPLPIIKKAEIYKKMFEEIGLVY